MLTQFRWFFFMNRLAKSIYLIGRRLLVIRIWWVLMITAGQLTHYFQLSTQRRFHFPIHVKSVCATMYNRWRFSETDALLFSSNFIVPFFRLPLKSVRFFYFTARAGIADFIQPSLGPLQPNLDDFMSEVPLQGNERLSNSEWMLFLAVFFNCNCFHLQSL